MKRLLSVLCTLVLLLSGCSAGESVPAAEGAGTEKAPLTGPEMQESALPEGSVGRTAPEGLTVEMEHEIYDASVERYTYFVHNNTTRPTGMFGEPYWVQRLENGVWQNLEAEDGIAFTAIGYALQPGGSMALTCWMGAFSEARTPGKYRLVKEIEDEIGRETYTLYAEFEIGESVYTADTPYGFASLEMLPENYSADPAGDLDMVFTADSIKNQTAVEDFLFKSGLNAPCQLRTVQDYSEGTPMVIDVIYENDHFLWRMWSEGVIVEKQFSYIVTDGEKLYLSNGADWESTLDYDSDKILLIPEGVTEQLCTAVQQQTFARLEGNTTRYKIWSADTGEGVWSASLWDYSESGDAPTSFVVEWHDKSGGGYGSSYDLQSWGGLETAITSLEWRFGGKLRLTCDTLDSAGNILEFDPETAHLTSSVLSEIPTEVN